MKPDVTSYMRILVIIGHNCPKQAFDAANSLLFNIQLSKGRRISGIQIYLKISVLIPTLER